MKSLKGTQTEKNILTAFAGESQARNRYDFFAAKAKSDGYVLVRDIFQETALQEIPAELLTRFRARNLCLRQLARHLMKGDTVFEV